MPRPHSLSLILASICAIPACSHSNGSGGKDAGSRGPDLVAHGDLPAGRADVTADASVAPADALSDATAVDRDGSAYDTDGAADAADAPADARPDTTALGFDGIDTPIVKNDAGTVDSPARWDGLAEVSSDGQDAGTDRMVRIVDGSAPLLCPGTVLLGGALPLAQSWGQNVLLADMNGDGRPDIVSESSIALGNGGGLFSPKVDLGNPGKEYLSEPLLPALGDLNGDGKLDLVVANDDNRVYVRLGKGDGTFAAPKEFGTAVGPLALVLVDLNGDKKLDALIVNYFSAVVSVHLGKGDGTFASNTDYDTAGAPVAMALGDLDGDKNLDAVTINDVPQGAKGTPTLSVLLGRGDGTFGASRDYVLDIALIANYQLGPYNPATAELGDVNGDGKLDLLVANSATGMVSVMLGKGDGTFAVKQDFATGSAPYDLVLGDIDDDGKLDILTANRNANTVSVLLGQGDGRFLPKQDYPAGQYPMSLALADLNGDGKRDLVVSSGSVLYGMGDGSFATSAKYPTGGYPVSVVLRDLDGDGVLDLVTANNSENTASVLLGMGDGTFSARQDYPTGDGPYQVELGDVNADGHADLVTANYNAGSVSVLLGTGDGSFAAKQDYPTGPGPSSVALGDFNADGKLDIAAAGGKTIFDSGKVSLLLGAGDGTFTPKVDHPAGVNTQSLALGDFNRDGKLDLVAANVGMSGDSSISVFLGKGDGSLASKIDLASASGPNAVTVGDLNGDGKLDLVTVNAGSGDPDAGPSGVSTVSVLLGKGDGSFAAKVDYPTGDFPISVVLGDLDGDGKLDVVTANRDSPTVSILYGKGDGTLAPRIDYAGAAGSLALGDLNADGRLDLVVTSGNAVSVVSGSCQ